MNCPYCDIHVDEHEASPCFDAWIAKDVMELEGVGQDSVGDFQYLHTPDRPFFVSRYSVYISAAWEVVEKLKAQYWYMALDTVDSGANVEFSKRKLGVESAIGNSTPLAICRAAIKVIGVDNDKT